MRSARLVGFWSLAADYVQPLANGMNFNASAQVSHNGKYTGLRLSDPAGVTVVNPSFTLVNAQISVSSERWELALNVENVLDDKLQSLGRQCCSTVPFYLK